MLLTNLTKFASMAKKKSITTDSVISLRALCEKAKMPQHKVYHNLRGTYDSLTHDEKQKLANAFYDGVSPLLSQLGFYITIKKIKDQVPSEG